MSKIENCRLAIATILFFIVLLVPVGSILADSARGAGAGEVTITDSSMPSTAIVDETIGIYVNGEVVSGSVTRPAAGFVYIGGPTDVLYRGLPLGRGEWRVDYKTGEQPEGTALSEEATIIFQEEGTYIFHAAAGHIEEGAPPIFVKDCYAEYTIVVSASMTPYEFKTTLVGMIGDGYIKLGAIPTDDLWGGWYYKYNLLQYREEIDYIFNGIHVHISADGKEVGSVSFIRPYGNFVGLLPADFCNRALAAMQEYIAVSPPPQYILTINIDPPFSGFITLIPPGGTYLAGTEVALTSVPIDGYAFNYWSGDTTGGQNPTIVTMNSDKTIVAYFEEILPDEHTLTINVNPTDGGTVTATPSGGSYEAGTIVALTANPNEGYEFDHWSGGASGGSPTTTVTMNMDRSVTAHFEEERRVPGFGTLAVIIAMGLIAIYYHRRKK